MLLLVLPHWRIDLRRATLELNWVSKYAEGTLYWIVSGMDTVAGSIFSMLNANQEKLKYSFVQEDQHTWTCISSNSYTIAMKDNQQQRCAPGCRDKIIEFIKNAIARWCSQPLLNCRNARDSFKSSTVYCYLFLNYFYLKVLSIALRAHRSGFAHNQQVI